MTHNERASTLAALRDARARVEQGWCQGRLAEDALGREVPPNSDEAVAWCALGAVDTDEAEMALVRALMRPRFGEGWSHPPALSIWNDKAEREQADVLALYDRAIEMVEAA